MENRLVDLEVRISFQEKIIQELNDVIVRQQGQIDQLEILMYSIRSQLKALAPSMVALQNEESLPPHY